MSKTGVIFDGNQVGAPNWLQNLTPELAKFPARLDPTLFNDDAGVRVLLGANASPGTNEQQTITIDATGGTWTVALTSDPDKVTAALADSVSTADLETALEGLVGAGNIRVVSGTPSSSYVIEFMGDYANQNISNTFFTLGVGNLTGGGATASIAQSTAGAAGATSLTVTALERPIPKGAMLVFGNQQVARVSADAAKAATSISIDWIGGYLRSGDSAYWSPYPMRKTILAGRLVGRTYAERDAGTAFGPADVNLDDEIFLLAFTLPDAMTSDDCELLLPCKENTIKENYLPGYSDLTTAELTWLRSNYSMIKGA